MKGIETFFRIWARAASSTGSDHCPAMKGIETTETRLVIFFLLLEATTAPQ